MTLDVDALANSCANVYVRTSSCSDAPTGR